MFKTETAASKFSWRSEAAETILRPCFSHGVTVSPLSVAPTARPASTLSLAPVIDLLSNTLSSYPGPAMASDMLAALSPLPGIKIYRRNFPSLAPPA